MKGQYILFDFTDKMIDYMRISDLIVTRAGINTLAEIAALKKPAIIIPYRYSAASHQDANARYFEKTAAGLVISDQDLNPEMFTDHILNLLSDQKQLKRLGENAYNNNQFSGAVVVANLINEVASGKK
jgi:UDP-N-acetylglucosamine--N-acetylmuramyl-(pentapeptide) pyrophosphoryl-undecaprenol N-acetylglucosamine transferase